MPKVRRNRGIVKIKNILWITGDQVRLGKYEKETAEWLVNYFEDRMFFTFDRPETNKKQLKKLSVMYKIATMAGEQTIPGNRIDIYHVGSIDEGLHHMVSMKDDNDSYSFSGDTTLLRLPFINASTMDLEPTERKQEEPPKASIEEQAKELGIPIIEVTKD